MNINSQADGAVSISIVQTDEAGNDSPTAIHTVNKNIFTFVNASSYINNAGVMNVLLSGSGEFEASIFMNVSNSSISIPNIV